MGIFAIFSYSTNLASNTDLHKGCPGASTTAGPDRILRTALLYGWKTTIALRNNRSLPLPDGYRDFAKEVREDLSPKARTDFVDSWVPEFQQLKGKVGIIYDMWYASEALVLYESLKTTDAAKTGLVYSHIASPFSMHNNGSQNFETNFIVPDQHDGLGLYAFPPYFGGADRKELEGQDFARGKELVSYYCPGCRQEVSSSFGAALKALQAVAMGKQHTSTTRNVLITMGTHHAEQTPSEKDRKDLVGLFAQLAKERPEEFFFVHAEDAILSSGAGALVGTGTVVDKSQIPSSSSVVDPQVNPE